MGNDYYMTNEHMVSRMGTPGSGEIFGYYVITHQYFRRYKLPVMHTETNIKMPASEMAFETMGQCTSVKKDGVPVVALPGTACCIRLIGIQPSETMTALSMN